MKRCPYCGQKITVDAAQCKHCGKQVRKVKESDSAAGMTSLKTYEEKRVPAWVMYGVVAMAIFCCVLMGLKGCESAPASDTSKETSEQAELNTVPSIIGSHQAKSRFAYYSDDLIG